MFNKFKELSHFRIFWKPRTPDTSGVQKWSRTESESCTQSITLTEVLPRDKHKQRIGKAATWSPQHHGHLTRCVNCGLRMRRECRERFPHHRLQRKSLVSDPDMHHGMCITHVPWCMSGSLTRGGGKTFPAFPAHAQPAILRIRLEAHSIRLFHVLLLHFHC